MLAGAHMPIAGGIYRAFERGAHAGCRTIQVFLKNSNRWDAKPLTDRDRELYLQAQKKYEIHPVIAHDSYLINLASPDERLHRKSLNAFIGELQRAAFLGIPYLVLHPGAHTGSGEDAGIRRVAEALNEAMDRVDPSVMILVENTAGQGTYLGHSFGHLASIMECLNHSERVGVCLDTCHLFAAGYEIRTKSGYRKTMQEFNRLIGLQNIKAFHLNDSKKDKGSRVDRHCHIGQGCIGLEAFRSIVNDRRFVKVPKILETPKGPDLKEDRMNLATLRSLLLKPSKVEGQKSEV
ncbi:MAG: deoxyribonuclease IV [Acidobacteriota bacterium]